MILIEDNWEEVNDLQDAACLVRSYYNSDLADEIEKLTPIHSDEEYQELLDKVYDLEKENEDLQDENCSLDSKNDMLREKIEQLEDILES